MKARRAPIKYLSTQEIQALFAVIRDVRDRAGWLLELILGADTMVCRTGQAPMLILMLG